MPLLATPRIVLAFEHRAGARDDACRPGANTPFMPVRALGAPQTTWTTPLPVSTMQTRSRSALGCCTASTT